MRKICKQKIRKRGLWDGSTWATLNTGTCFSVSSDDKLVLFLFPGIPMGEPAIVAFYDKRIYIKSYDWRNWPLISRKETASEYDKINNCAMLSIQCMSRRDLSVKRGNKWEMLSYEAWTDGRTAVCHNKPVFWRAYKNEWSISWNYEYVIFGQIIFQNIHQFKAFVGLSDCRIIATAPISIYKQFRLINWATIIPLCHLDQWL